MGYKSYSTPFHLKDTDFSCGRRVFAVTSTEGDLQAEMFFTLTFMTQKNGVRGGKVGHKSSGEPLLCPKTDLLQRVLHLIFHRATHYTPLSCVMNPAGRWKKITLTMTMKTLKTAVGFCGQDMGFETKDIYVCSLCATGAMYLLCLGFGRNIINMIGCWISNEMLQYLHVQS